MAGSVRPKGARGQIKMNEKKKTNSKINFQWAPQLNLQNKILKSVVEFTEIFILVESFFGTKTFLLNYNVDFNLN